MFEQNSLKIKHTRITFQEFYIPINKQVLKKKTVVSIRFNNETIDERTRLYISTLPMKLTLFYTE